MIASDDIDRDCRHGVQTIEDAPHRGYDRRVRVLTIDGRTIDDAGPAYVIAEIGHNHQGDLEKAKALVRAAADCGVDAVKVQKRDNRSPRSRWMARRHGGRHRGSSPRVAGRRPRGARAGQQRDGGRHRRHIDAPRSQIPREPPPGARS